MSELAKYDAITRAIAAAVKTDELIKINDKAKALAAAAKIAKDRTALIDLTIIRARAERRIGQMMADGADERAKVGKPKKGSQKPITLEDLGIGKSMADRARTLAACPDKSFDEIIADFREIEAEQEDFSGYSREPCVRSIIFSVTELLDRPAREKRAKANAAKWDRQEAKQKAEEAERKANSAKLEAERHDEAYAEYCELCEKHDIKPSKKHFEEQARVRGMYPSYFDCWPVDRAASLADSLASYADTAREQIDIYEHSYGDNWNDDCAAAVADIIKVWSDYRKKHNVK